MKRLALIMIAVLAFSCSEGSKKDTNISEEIKNEEPQFRPPSDFFSKEKAQVLMVGTFHLAYPGMDEHKTDEEDQIDILKEPKKSELTELIEYIKQFKPTKIAIEAHSNWNADKKLIEYKEGMHHDKRDERYSIAMRLAKDLNIDTLYSVDANALSQDIYKRDSIFAMKLVEKVDWEAKDPVSDMQYDWYAYNDKITTTANLLDYFKYMNSPESHKYIYGAYLTGWFKDESNQGADHLSMWWYNRNLRIFRNILGITTSPEDRVLILIGNGHAGILRQLIEVSPEMDFVEFSSL